MQQRNRFYEAYRHKKAYLTSSFHRSSPTNYSKRVIDKNGMKQGRKVNIKQEADTESWIQVMELFSLYMFS